MEKILASVFEDSAVHFIIESIVLCKKHKDIIFKKSPDGKKYFEATLTINGIEVPFEKTIKDFYERCKNQVDQLAAEKALEIVKESGLTKLNDVLYQSEKMIKRQIEKIVGHKFDEEYW